MRYIGYKRQYRNLGLTTTLPRHNHSLEIGIPNRHGYVWRAGVIFRSLTPGAKPGYLWKSRPHEGAVEIRHKTALAAARYLIKQLRADTARYYLGVW